MELVNHMSLKSLADNCQCRIGGEQCQKREDMDTNCRQRTNLQRRGNGRQRTLVEHVIGKPAFDAKSQGNSVLLSLLRVGADILER